MNGMKGERDFREERPLAEYPFDQKTWKEKPKGTSNEKTRSKSSGGASISDGVLFKVEEPSGLKKCIIRPYL